VKCVAYRFPAHDPVKIRLKLRNSGNHALERDRVVDSADIGAERADLRVVGLSDFDAELSFLS
jgi:hypothetical protein